MYAVVYQLSGESLRQTRDKGKKCSVPKHRAWLVRRVCARRN